MAINIFNIKKWYRMLSGKSILHVNQNIGTCFIPGEIKGYFNDLSEKVLKEPNLLLSDLLPTSLAETGEKVFFPVAIMQYGLGAYDLYLKTHEDIYKKKFMQCVEWVFDNQEETGAWNNYFYIYPENPYSAMCQGEGASLLLRAYLEKNDEKYKEAANRALSFMIKPIGNGGTAQYTDDGGILLLEYTHFSAVLNGWVFALFGLYDYCLVEDDEALRRAFDLSLSTLIKNLSRYSCNYWSMYDLSGRIASPFYHNLHIAQMHALSLISDDSTFEKYEIQFRKNQRSFFCRIRSFLVKAFQKIVE